jgi:hypothetical protein
MFSFILSSSGGNGLGKTEGVCAAYKITVKRVASVVTVREDERLLALALRPPVLEQRRVPVDLVEDMRDVDVSGRAILLLAGGAEASRPRHVVLVVLETDVRVVAGREVDVGTERRSVAVAVHVGEAGTGALVVGILDPDAVHAVGVGWVGGDVVIGARAGELDGLDGAVGRIEDLCPAGGGWCAELRVATEHAKALREGHDRVVGGFEAGEGRGELSVSDLGKSRLGVEGLQIVDVHVKHGNVFEGVVGFVVEVHLRSPVGALVVFDQRRRASG